MIGLGSVRFTVTMGFRSNLGLNLGIGRPNPTTGSISFPARSPLLHVVRRVATASGPPRPAGSSPVPPHFRWDSSVQASPRPSTIPARGSSRSTQTSPPRAGPRSKGHEGSSPEGSPRMRRQRQSRRRATGDQAPPTVEAWEEEGTVLLKPGPVRAPRRARRVGTRSQFPTRSHSCQCSIPW